MIKERYIILSLILTLIAIGLGTLSNEAPLQVEPSSEVATKEIREPATMSELEVTTTEAEPEYELYDVPLSDEMQIELADICKEYDIEYSLILAIISVECNTFDPGVKGDNGNSIGLMQIQPKWWRELMEREGVTDLTDPIQNVTCGCAIMRYLIDTYDSEYRALQAYNTGNPNSKNGYADKVYQKKDEIEYNKTHNKN